MLRKMKRTKRAITLVELIVAMALTAIFAVACVSLIFPVSQIYTHSNELARAQLVADNVASCLRAACTGNNVAVEGDAWIASSGYELLTDADVVPALSDGEVLVIRKSPDYCMTIASNYEINGALYTKVMNNDSSEDAMYSPETDSSGLTTRAIYRMFNGEPESDAFVASSSGRVHLGYFSAGTNNDQYVFPENHYDFTDPLTNSIYDGYEVGLQFSDLTCDIDSGAPAYVNCTITVSQDGVTAYTRTIALRLS